MNKNYLVILTPFDWFCFGGERTHGEGEKSEYLSKSNLFPQQSAILGMIRYQLLKQKGLLTKPGEKIDYKIDLIHELIGERSFNITKISEDFQFGKIRQISPLTIIEKNKSRFYFSMPLDNGYDIQFIDIENIYLNGNKKTDDGRGKIIDDSNSFDHKTYTNYTLWQSKDKQIDSQNIWARKIKIGITKLKKGDLNDDKNFYKQEYLLFKDSFAYAFFLALEDGTELNQDKVFLGGERSIFDMEVLPVNENVGVFELLKKEAPYVADNEKIILLSDSYVEDMDKLNALCRFHWSYSLPFRNIQTTTSKENYFVKPEKSDKKYNFMQRGSVLYFNAQNKQLIENILNNTYLQSAGYNQYI
jgi:CRISPR type III-B/RAMP module-associated protein Cmr3